MIISHRLSFMFFRVPRTGSSTATHVLQNCNVFDDKDITTYSKSNEQRRYAYGWHTTPEQAIKFGLTTFKQLYNYNCFAFFREPRARYYSAHNRGLTHKEMQLQKNFFFVNDIQVVTALDYDNYEIELRKILSSLNTTYGEFPCLNSREPKETWEKFWTEERTKLFLQDFSEDLIFYEKIKGK